MADLSGLLMRDCSRSSVAFVFQHRTLVGLMTNANVFPVELTSTAQLDLNRIASGSLGEQPDNQNTGKPSLAYPGPSSVEMCGRPERWAGQRSAASQRSRAPPAQWLRFVWNSSLVLSRDSARHPAHTDSSLGEQRRSDIIRWFTVQLYLHIFSSLYNH